MAACLSVLQVTSAGRPLLLSILGFYREAAREVPFSQIEGQVDILMTMMGQYDISLRDAGGASILNFICAFGPQTTGSSMWRSQARRGLRCRRYRQRSPLIVLIEFIPPSLCLIIVQDGQESSGDGS